MLMLSASYFSAMLRRLLLLDAYATMLILPDVYAISFRAMMSFFRRIRR